MNTEMKKEDLIKLSVNDLSDIVLTLEKRIKELREKPESNQNDYWFEKHEKLNEKFMRFREIVKSIVLFID
jgi:hypothetical protein